MWNMMFFQQKSSKVAQNVFIVNNKKIKYKEVQLDEVRHLKVLLVFRFRKVVFKTLICLDYICLV